MEPVFILFPGPIVLLILRHSPLDCIMLCPTLQMETVAIAHVLSDVVFLGATYSFDASVVN